MDVSHDDFTKQFIQWFANKLNIEIFNGGLAVFVPNSSIFMPTNFLGPLIQIHLKNEDAYLRENVEWVFKNVVTGNLSNLTLAYNKPLAEMILMSFKDNQDIPVDEFLKQFVQWLSKASKFKWLRGKRRAQVFMSNGTWKFV